MIYFSSDFHFFHTNICRGVSKWNNLDKTRDFANVKEMNQAIIYNINSVVGPNDILYTLGDSVFQSVDNHIKIREMINCNNIHYICGNHCNKHDTEFDPMMSNGKKVSSLYSSYQHYKTFYAHKTKFVLFHFPIYSWDNMSKGSIHLFGHCHSAPENRFFNGGKSMDVGVDGNNYKPYSMDEIMDIMKNRPIENEGHH